MDITKNTKNTSLLPFESIGLNKEYYIMFFWGEKIPVYMVQFDQFGLKGFKRGQTHFSQLHISLDPV